MSDENRPESVEKSATDSGTAVLAKNDGIVEKMDADHVTVRNAQGGVDNYPLVKFARSNAGTCINQRPIVAGVLHL